MTTPSLDEDLRFPQCKEHLTVQEFIPQLAVEAFVVAVLPSGAWLDVERLDANASEPVSNGSGDEFGPIVGTNVSSVLGGLR